MPSSTPRQHRFMAAECTNNTGRIAKNVACEFMHADKGRKVARGKKTAKRRSKK